jgi:hypothetical protein
MSQFDFKVFFENHGIDYISSGKNVKAGWHNVRCPFCGEADPGYHMGCNPETGGWACWRDRGHKGRSVPKLIDALLGCGWRKACELAGDWQEPMPVGDALLTATAAELDRETEIVRPHPIHWPPAEFKSLFGPSRLTEPYEHYLRDRGFLRADLEFVAKRYDLRAGLSGDWRGRLMLPFIGAKGRVYGWQGRAISKRSELRYLSYPDSSRVKKLLFNYGPALEAKQKKVLVVVEGPIDAIKVDFYGRLDRIGIRAVGTLGTSYMEAQVSLLYELCPMYDQTLILFDKGAETAAWELKDKLTLFSPLCGFVPDRYDDAGALPPDRVVPIITKLCRGA